MKHKRSNEYNIIHLFLGLLLGFFLGSTVIYWHFNRQNDRLVKDMLTQFMSVFAENTITSDTLLPTKTTSSLEADSIDKVQQKNPGLGEITSTTLSTSGTGNERNVLAKLIANTNLMEGYRDGPAQKHNSMILLDDDPQTYTIAQDKLLYTRRITLSVEDKLKTESEKILDSLLGNTYPTPNEHVYHIEFWESPLNSLGYKMGKNKIVFYGIHLFDFANISRHKGQLYLKYLNDYYPLEVTTSFKPLVPANISYLMELEDVN